MHLEWSEGEEEAVEHQADEGDEVQARQGLRQPLVVAGEAAEAGCPGEAALKDPVTLPLSRFWAWGSRGMVALLLSS